MTLEERFDLEKKLQSKNSSLSSLLQRICPTAPPNTTPGALEGVTDLSGYIHQHGGYHQQERMIRDKRKSLDRALLYSYQAAVVEKFLPEYMRPPEPPIDNGKKPPYRALMNPNKLKPDYDEKVISIGYEHGFHTGDIFKWLNTNTYWLIYLQEETEFAYFRGNCRRCRYEIKWEDKDDKVYNTYCAVSGPVETQINSISKGGDILDTPNHSLNIYMSRTKETVEYFQRYAKFYLRDLVNPDIFTCWRVAAVDSISTPNIIQLHAVEYYANEFEDDIQEGVAGGKIFKKEDPNNEEINSSIIGDSYIKPKKKYKYEYSGTLISDFEYTQGAPVKIEKIDDKSIYLSWTAPYTGEFELKYGDLTKQIIVESLF